VSSGRYARPWSAHQENPFAAVRAEGLTKSYRQGADEIHALRGVDISVEHGEFLTVTGASGSGKSTLLHVLGGLDRPDAGEVFIEGSAIGSLDDDRLAALRRRRLGFVLQFFNLLPTLTAAENAAFPLMLEGTADALERARAALASVGLAERTEHRPSQLSGGEQQRVALARAMVTEPAVVFADEPTGNLDSITGRDILELLRASADRGQTIVMVTHDERTAEFADRVVRLVDGRLMEIS
jgi:putative ABC transport system ATP-binding protein